MTLLNTFVVTGIVKYAAARPVPAVQMDLQNVITDSAQIAPTVASNPQTSKVPPATVKPTPATPKPTTKPSTPSPTKASTPSSTPAPTVAPATPKPAGCIIQIDGVKYNITSLVKTHSGGNVFTCGTDMSAIFWGKHNAKILQIMQQYRI